MAQQTVVTDVNGVALFITSGPDHGLARAQDIAWRFRDAGIQAYVRTFVPLNPGNAMVDEIIAEKLEVLEAATQQV